MNKKILLLPMILLFFAVGCSSDNESDNQSNDKVSVYTSIYPLNYLVEEIAGDRVNINSIVSQGTDPHEYEISLKDVAKIREADLLVYNGLGLESWGQELSSEMDKNSIMVASDYVNKLPIDSYEENHHEDDHEEHDEEHSEDDGHNHEGEYDPHIWLSPENMKKIAVEIEARLTELDSENSDYYKENREDLVERLDNLSERYRTELVDRVSDTILVSHRAFSYLVDEYGLKQVAVTGISPQAEPTPREISELIDLTENEDIDYIFFEVLSSPKSVEMISNEADLEVSILDPIGSLTKENIESGQDYISIMEENLENIKKELLE